MSFDETILRCSAPSLCGIKPSCLFSIDGTFFSGNREALIALRNSFCIKQRFFVPIKKEENRFLFFVYDRLLLEELCAKKENIEYLRTKNYPVQSGFKAILAEFIYRLAHQKHFPHEAGLFLGYPLEDVIGFELNCAKNFLYSGLWKVYGNTQKSLSLMNDYKDCTQKCISFYRQGLSVQLTAKKYCSLRAE